jgi:acylphosphatase
MTEPDLRSVHVRISGRVQRVWFRGWTLKTATSLNLSGWVRNRRDGTLEAVFEGEHDAVERMLSLCHDGPPHAKVTSIEVGEETPANLSGFRSRDTA